MIDKIFHRKRQVFFLEIGGGDGLHLSNTLILEANFEWRGVLVEPTGAFKSMVQNRPKAICDHAAIAGSRKTVRLFEILDKGQAELQSGISSRQYPLVCDPSGRYAELGFQGRRMGICAKKLSRRDDHAR